jgi:hypothetical protein
LVSFCYSFDIFLLLLWYLLVTPLISSGYSFGIFWLFLWCLLVTPSVSYGYSFGIFNLPASGYSFGIIKFFLCTTTICDQLWHRDIKCPLKMSLTLYFVICFRVSGCMIYQTFRLWYVYLDILYFPCIGLYDIPHLWTCLCLFLCLYCIFI